MSETPLDLNRISDDHIPLDDSSTEEANQEQVDLFISQAEFDKHKKDFSQHKNILNLTFGFVMATFVVCFLSFVTFLFDAWELHNEREKEYMEVVKSLRESNIAKEQQIRELNEQSNYQKFESLKERILLLEKRNSK